ncbi:barstar family protein [Allostreptomyces psammosilenae]|uniref:barstar family protein n=1 Tax=Allostreptomyces psammosilenae TaxID=1892865 RepID=UPI0035E43A92
MSQLLPPADRFFTARLDGKRMADSWGLFDECSRAFSLPVDFEWSWPSLSVCLRSLEWISARHYLAIATDPSMMLSREPAERQLFFVTMQEVGSAWAGRSERDHTGAFNVVLLCGRDEVETLKGELAALSPLQ